MQSIQINIHIILKCCLYSDLVIPGDFGISKVMDATIDVASTCVGTPSYLSPEMCQDIPYSSKADVWVTMTYSCFFYKDL